MVISLSFAPTPSRSSASGSTPASHATERSMFVEGTMTRLRHLARPVLPAGLTGERSTDLHWCLREPRLDGNSNGTAALSQVGRGPRRAVREGGLEAAENIEDQILGWRSVKDGGSETDWLGRAHSTSNPQRGPLRRAWCVRNLCLRWGSARVGSTPNVISEGSMRSRRHIPRPHERVRKSPCVHTAGPSLWRGQGSSEGSPHSHT